MKMRFLAAVLAAFFMFPHFSVAAYAGGGDNVSNEDSTQQEEQSGIIDITPRTEAPSATITVTDNTETENAGDVSAQEPDGTINPFTPSGTGTAIDNATEVDGKEFFTIMTPDENVFYLVIDRQRGTENVYLLNAVTEADLLALAEMPEQAAPVVTEPTPAPAEYEPEPTPEKSGGAGMIIMVIVIVLGGGGAGWYFKIYRPKQQQADSGEEFDGEDYGEDESDPYGDEQDAEADYDGADWDAVDNEPDGDGGE